MDLTRISKYMSKILRHKPELIGIKIEYHGAWAKTDELIAGIRRTLEPKFNLETLKKIVAEDKKQRYSFTDNYKKIRANQGHSIDVDMGYVPTKPPETLFHGTTWRNIGSINKEGLNSGDRQYVHLSRDEVTAIDVGSRHGKPFIYRVLAGQMYRDGYEFYISDNGVWLTKEVPPRYLEGMYDGGALYGQQASAEQEKA